jgi:CDP-paratose 2-epimerase
MGAGREGDAAALLRLCVSAVTMQAMRNILVTGGAGFVGSHLALEMKAAYPGARVVALDSLVRRGSALNLPRLAAGGVEFLRGDVRNEADLMQAGAVDLLVECSAEPSVLAGYGESPRYVIDTNLVGTINCLELARQHGAGLIFLSTSRVYPMARLSALRLRETETRFELEADQTIPGVSAAGIREDFPLEGPRSLYGATKLASELLVTEYASMYGLRTVVNRCGVLTGPWQMGKVDQGVVVLWVARHHFGGPLSYFGYGGRGKQVRDILHVADLCELVLHQVAHLDAFSGRTWNIGGGREISVSLCELTAHCRAATGRSVPVASVPENRAADVPLYLSDTGRIRAASGWQPRRGVVAIIEEIARWIRDEENTLQPILG